MIERAGGAGRAGRARAFAVLALVLIARVSPTTFARTVVNGSAAAVYPVVAPVNGAAVTAWTNGTGAGATIRVERVQIR